MSDTSGIRAIAQAFRLTGWISFWTQLVLGIVSAGILLSAIVFSRGGNNSNNPGTGFGAFFAVAGLIALGIGIYLAFRYTRIGRGLDSSNANNRPRKIETVQVLQFALVVHLAGMLLTLLGAQAIAGTLIVKSLTLPQFGVGVYTQIDPNRIIQPIDIFVVQANTNTVTAHFAGLVSSIWLLYRLSKPQS
ncbi:DUF3611 family protein [Scytonema sp. UIC 10036]|uniref:DUF3611 family protein n=1 Tax=Scytonema sp. UIC 10036 TaxID=2304196 RepID=UPI001FAAC67D|nr:DUF3611 family protein [Scytonema sp. UIC 10036]